jgi:hypothetical protein
MNLRRRNPVSTLSVERSSELRANAERRRGLLALTNVRTDTGGADELRAAKDLLEWSYARRRWR